MEIRQMVFVPLCSRTIQHKDTGENVAYLAEVQESEKARSTTHTPVAPFDVEQPPVQAELRAFPV